MADARFIHLNARSAFSLLEGALPIKRLLQLARDDDMPALGVADACNMFGALEFSELAREHGIQPIIGCKLPVRFETSQNFGASAADPARTRAPVTLLAASADGYANLTRLVTSAYLEGDDGIGGSFVDVDDLVAAAGGLIALTGGIDGPLYSAFGSGEAGVAESRLAALAKSFGDRLYISIERHGSEVEGACENDVLALAYANEMPIVATNEPFFATRADYEAHDALLAIAAGAPLSSDDRHRLTPEHHFATQSVMAERFTDLPEAVENTLEIAQRCHHRALVRMPILPRFTAGEVGQGDTADVDDTAEADELRAQAHQGLRERLKRSGTAPGVDEQAYLDRLNEELDIIDGMNFPGYFLIVADFIKWAKGRGIPVGPGRGSGAGSLVAYALTITDLDPIRFDLLFERFLNPDRVSMPDFDIDFCQERRDEVIRYVQKRYGADHVAQIITFGTLQARAVLRDVGRVLEMPYGQVDQLCKLVPANPANPVKLADAVASEPRLSAHRDSDERVAKLLDTALKLEGLYRHASTHAAGIVIGDRPLRDLVPLYRDPRSDLPVTQFNMKWVEKAGLVKFDFLGLKTLTVIDKTLRLIEAAGRHVDIDSLPLDCEKTYAHLARGETVGVFQLESPGMRRALVGMRADRFEDIIALVALYRPGPMDNIPTYNRRKHGLESPEYLHPKLEPILKETYGVIIYQEQVMQIARTLSGYTLGEADLLRRAMGKKIKSEMDAQRSRFIEGAADRGTPKATAQAIFDLVLKFANYGFNKSHAAAYALIAYQTAYLKAHYPVEFLAASMTLDMGNSDKLNDFRHEAARLGIEIVPPCVNRSGPTFNVEDGRILYALCALKGVGQQAVEHIVSIRADRPFSDLSDFSDRIDPRIVNKRTVECLAAAGAFDCLDRDRACVFGNAARILGAANERISNHEAGFVDLFGDSADRGGLELRATPPWTTLERLQREFTAIGFYLSAHPLNEYEKVLEGRGVMRWNDFEKAARAGSLSAGTLAGTVVQRQERRTRTGGKIGIFRFSDPSGQFEAVAYSEQLSGWREMLEPGESVVLKVGADYDDESEELRIRLHAVEPLEAAAARSSCSLTIFFDRPNCVDSIAKRLENAGDGKVRFVLMLGSGREVDVRLPGTFRLTPQVAGAIKTVDGVSRVELA